MEKFCVFCGKPPEDKNQEHIIPRWLMKMTDTENKAMSVGSNWEKTKEYIFNFSRFTFPACTKCNTEFSLIESKVKPVIEYILNDEFVTAEELELLLDWFDKVRICLWLGVQYLNKSSFDFPPKYFVNTRLKLKDRLLAITNTYDKSKTLKWTGANTLAFVVSPTCFTLKINNIIFVNCSSDFLISEQIGFPTPIFVRPNPNSPGTDFGMRPGNKMLRNKLFNTRLYEPCTFVYQPIFSLGKSLTPNLYNTAHVKSHSYDFDKGVGKIFVNHDGLSYPMEYDEEISFESANKDAKNYRLNAPTLSLQIELLNSIRYNLELLNEEQRIQHFQAKKMIVSYTKEQIKQYNY